MAKHKYTIKDGVVSMTSDQFATDFSWLLKFRKTTDYPGGIAKVVIGGAVQATFEFGTLFDGLDVDNAPHIQHSFLKSRGVSSCFKMGEDAIWLGCERTAGQWVPYGVLRKEYVSDDLARHANINFVPAEKILPPSYLQNGGAIKRMVDELEPGQYAMIKDTGGLTHAWLHRPDDVAVPQTPDATVTPQRLGREWYKRHRWTDESFLKDVFAQGGSVIGVVSYDSRSFPYAVLTPAGMKLPG